MKHTPLRTIVPGALVGAILAGSLVATMGAQATADPDISGVSVLNQRAGADDVLPSVIDLDALDETILEDSLRFAGEGLGAQHWAALTSTGAICLISYIDGIDWVAGATCARPADFAAVGAGLRLLGPEGEAEAYLVPDTATELDSQLKRVGENLVITDPRGVGDFRNLAGDRTRQSGDFKLKAFVHPMTEKIGEQE